MKLDQIYNTLLSEHVTEKTANAGMHNQRVFKVVAHATKHDVKASIEKLFNVVVDHVNIVNRKGKTTTFRGRQGKKQSQKFAYVTLKAGHEIDFAKLS